MEKAFSSGSLPVEADNNQEPADNIFDSEKALTIDHFDSPCLMSAKTRSNSSSWKVFDSSQNRFFSLEFPELMGAEIRFSKSGWLLMSRRDNSLFFFNPLTKVKTVDLPTTPVPFLQVCFTSPPTSSDCMVCGFSQENHIGCTVFSIIKFGGREWNSKGYGHYDCNNFRISNCSPVFYRGAYYCLDVNGNLGIFDPTKNFEGREWTWYRYCTDKGFCFYLPNSREGVCETWAQSTKDWGEALRDFVRLDGVLHQCYLAEVGGDIVSVFVMGDERQVSVQRFDFARRKWFRIKSFGDECYCLYVSPFGSFGEKCVSDSKLANTVYLNKFHGENGVLYSLATGMYRLIEGDYASKGDEGMTDASFGAWIKPSV